MISVSNQLESMLSIIATARHCIFMLLALHVQRISTSTESVLKSSYVEVEYAEFLTSFLKASKQSSCSPPVPSLTFQNTVF